MTTAACRKSGRKHTQIVSELQRWKFREELRRRTKGLSPQMASITEKELVAHLREAEGKKLPFRAQGKRRKR